MADQVLTKQKLINADEDLGDLEEVLNGPPGKLIKTRLGREVYTLASVPQINTMTREEVAAAVAPKANKADVDTALSNLSTTANKFYPTLAEANYYITTMAVNDVVTIGEEANKGLWYKATAGATTLTKSAYDPKTQAVTEAKTYADTNKLDLSKIITEYVDGNKIGPKTPRYTNLGLTNTFGISAASFYDSAVLRVKEGDVLFLLNDTANYNASAGAGFAFFAEDPNVNRTQVRITDNRASATDTATSLVHQKVTVPTGAKYLMINTRFTNFNGTIDNNFVWTVHSGKFSNSYVAGTEMASRINDVAISTNEDITRAKLEAIAQSKIYTDSKILIESDFSGGNIVANSGINKTNLGVGGSLAISVGTTFDCVVVPVVASDVLYIFNDKQSYNPSAGSGFAFFALDPVTNTSQTRVTHTDISETDSATSIQYRKVTVPDGSNFLLLNTRFTASGTGVITNFTWAVHKNKFVNSYTKGTEQIIKINGLGIGGEEKTNKFDFDYLEFSVARFYGKTIFSYGDSITQGTDGGYTKYLSQILNCTVNNYGSSGSTAKRLVDIVVAGSGIPRRDALMTEWVTKDYTQCSAVTIQIGTNDFQSGSIADIPISNLTDYANPLDYWALFPSNFVANIALCIEYIKSKNSDCEIFLITPPYRNIDGDTPSRMSAVLPFLKLISEHYSIPLVNSMQESGIGFKYMKANIKYSYDGIHFNALGNKLWGKYIARKILSGS